ncbi:MAG TPA: nickel pincer cofactor biosynthesis protein LarC [Terriglobales bacterium]|nr:nickel pincer cofactor biosynthesis protein LarC [Terriglobales bacterium]
MRVAYLECFSGISGDMMLGGLIDAGVSKELLQRTVAALNIGAELRVNRVDRSGISATKIDVLVNGKPTEHSDHSHDHEHIDDQRAHSHEHGLRHEHQHANGGEHAHSGQHSHDHQHGRSLSEIKKIIRSAELAEQARETAICAFELLGGVEAGIHNVPMDTIHFHEVGAVDAIVDIVCASVGCHALDVDRFICSPLNVGGGTVKCAHGEFPVPAPATLALLKGAPVYSSGINKELVTPTGAALVRALNCSFSAFPQMSVQKIGYGAGSRDLHGSPNVLRISIGELVEAHESCAGQPAHHEVTVLETTIDDLSPQVMGYVTERLLAEGALDVFVIPAQMKKNRPGSLLTVLCDQNTAPALREVLFRETSTIGIRTRRERRDCLERAIVPVSTQWGIVRLKESRLNGTVTNFAPEYEDCRRIAEANSVPLKQVQQETISSYLAQREHTTPTSGDGSKRLSTKSHVA